MAKGILLLALCAAFVSTAELLAHEDQPHIMGTVAGVHANEVVVATQDGRSVTILLTKDTAYRSIDRSGGAGVVAKQANLRPGSRVVVEVNAEGGTLTATQVSFSSVPKAPEDGTPGNTE